jgi:hypothetical protein
MVAMESGIAGLGIGYMFLARHFYKDEVEEWHGGSDTCHL